GIVQLNGSAIVTLTGTNTYASGTVINAGALLVGNGGTSGSIGSGPVTDNTLLVWNRSDDATFAGAISGSGSFVKMGAGSLTLTTTNTSYTGSTTVSNGTLVLASGNIASDLNMEGGTFVPGSTSSVITNTVAGSLNLNSGTLVAVLNKSNPQSNTVYQVNGGLNNVAGTVRVVNAGPALAI